MIAEVARLLKENKKKLPFGLYVVNAVQEEIGLRGAEMIARRIKPDIAIITDVTHDTTTPMINKMVQGECSCGKGPSLTYGPAVHNKLLDIIKATAVKNKIDVQFVMYRRPVSKRRAFTTTAFALYHFINHRCGSIMCNIGNNGNIRFYTAGNHFCTTQTNFFLHCIHHI